MNEENALAQHPELAQLWTLHFTARVSLHALRVVQVDPKGRSAFADLQTRILDVINAIERYKDRVQAAPKKHAVLLPEGWSADRAEAVLDFLRAVGPAVEALKR